jgi:two-component system, chemotaxis family, protein-glutamate methylesterase/glutaminase
MCYTCYFYNWRSAVANRSIIVVGASAGGVEALSELVAHLPTDFPAAIFIVLHVPSHGTSVLPRILSRAGFLPAIHPQDSQPIQSGHIYVAPPNLHLLVKNGYVTLARGPKENGHRPGIDPLFRSAARVYGNRVIGVILTGTLDDGTAGLQAIKMRGGITVVQSPEDAMYSGMPLSAIEHVDVDYIKPVKEIADLLVRLTQETISDDTAPAIDTINREADMAELDKNALEDENGRPGTPSAFACPECGGTLWEIHDSDLIRFRCRTGHAFSAQTLLAEQAEALEEALWIALRALEENASLANRMAQRSEEQGRHHSATHFSEEAEAARQRAEIIRQALLQGTLTLKANEENREDYAEGQDEQKAV